MVISRTGEYINESPQEQVGVHVETRTLSSSAQTEELRVNSRFAESETLFQAIGKNFLSKNRSYQNDSSPNNVYSQVLTS